MDKCFWWYLENEKWGQYSPFLKKFFKHRIIENLEWEHPEHPSCLSQICQTPGLCNISGIKSNLHKTIAWGFFFISLWKNINWCHTFIHLLLLLIVLVTGYNLFSVTLVTSKSLTLKPTANPLIDEQTETKSNRIWNDLDMTLI